MNSNRRSNSIIDAFERLSGTTALWSTHMKLAVDNITLCKKEGPVLQVGVRGTDAAADTIVLTMWIHDEQKMVASFRRVLRRLYPEYAKLQPTPCTTATPSPPMLILRIVVRGRELKYALNPDSSRWMANRLAAESTQMVDAIQDVCVGTCFLQPCRLSCGAL